MRPRVLRDLGYKVAPAMFEHEDRPTVFSVSGHGVQTYFSADDLEAWNNLISAPQRQLVQSLADLLSYRATDLYTEPKSGV